MIFFLYEHIKDCIERTHLRSEITYSIAIGQLIKKILFAGNSRITHSNQIVCKQTSLTDHNIQIKTSGLGLQNVFNPVTFD